MKRLIFVVLVIVAGFWFWPRSRTYPPGILIHEEPLQTEIARPAPFASNGFTMTPLAKFSLKARVLHKRRYEVDEVSKLSPYDLAVGWGPMSDQAVLDRLQISQSGRFFFYEYSNPPPLPQDTIISHATNMHLIPATDEVRSQIGSLSKGALIQLKGVLVEVAIPDGPAWRSSLSRTDSGRGACEIVWVESIEEISPETEPTPTEKLAAK